VADGGNNRIQVFSSNGAYLTQWGSSTTFSNTLAVAVDANGDAYVADFHNNRIQVFSSDGAYLRQWGSSETFSGPACVALDATATCTWRISTFTASRSSPTLAHS
jgi:DNA-binding beta-propeller fold protein YncE